MPKIKQRAIVIFTHKGEDYYYVMVNGEEFEVPTPFGDALKELVRLGYQQAAKRLIHQHATRTS